MPPKRGKKPPSKRVFQPLPESSFWIENDAYDRRVCGLSPLGIAFAAASSKRPAVRFLPHFGSLLQDIFSLLFKYNVIFHRASDVVASALLNREISQWRFGTGINTNSCASKPCSTRRGPACRTALSRGTVCSHS